MIRYAVLLPPGHTPFHNSGAERVSIVADTVLSLRKRLKARGILVARIWGHAIDGSLESTAFVELKGARTDPP